jgi:hypothetical protein
MMITLKGIPVAYDLVPENLGERLAAEAVLNYFTVCESLPDKGFYKTGVEISDL